MNDQITGEWWNVDTEAIISQALQTGAGPNIFNAYTLNGLLGPLYNCSKGRRIKLISFLNLIKQLENKA